LAIKLDPAATTIAYNTFKVKAYNWVGDVEPSLDPTNDIHVIQK